MPASRVKLPCGRRVNAKWPSKSVMVVRGEEPGAVDVSLTVIPERMSVPFSPVEEVTFPLMDPEPCCPVFEGCCAKARIAQSRIAISIAPRSGFLMQSQLVERTFNGTNYAFGGNTLTWRNRFETQTSRDMRFAKIKFEASRVVRNSSSGRSN
jgi:hypothetical protein